MTWRTVSLVLLLAAVALAGCADGGSGTASDDNGDDIGIDRPEVREGRGAIIGVVVDASIVPLEGVTVVLQGSDLETSTNDRGAFVFSDLEPGDYFLRASKPGYHTAQQSVQVEAGVKDPDTVRMLLEADPESRPFYEIFSWRGFLECAFGVSGVGAVNPCFISDNSDNVAAHELEGGGTPDFVQHEMVWSGTGDIGSSLALMQYIPDSASVDGTDDFAREVGQSPLVVKAERELLEQKGIGTEYDVLLRVFPGGTDDDPATVFLNQEFTVYTHVFYNMLPPEGWQFSQDGDPPSPV